MTTHNMLDLTLLGQTGTGNIVGSASPTITTPNMIGVINGSVAAAGSIGEIISAVVTFASNTNYGTSSTAVNLLNLPLTAGDWDLNGNFGLSAAIAVQNIQGGFSISTGVLPNLEFRSSVLGLATASNMILTAPSQTINVSVNTTVFLVIFATYTGASATMFGSAYARRRH